MTEKTDLHTIALRFMRGHEDAAAFLTLLFSVFHTWDDIEDGDKPLTLRDVHEMMFMALVVIPRNRFYQQHFQELSAVVETAILNWHAANAMERGGNQRDLEIAFISRSDYINIAIKCAALVGGYEWAVSVAPEMRRFWHAEGFDKYRENLALQFAQEKESVHVLRQC